VTFGSDRHLNDACYEFVDVIAINEFYGWSYGSIYDIGAVLDGIRALRPDKPILVSAFGAGAPLGSKGDSAFRSSGRNYSEDYQMRFLEAHLSQVFDPRRADYVCGGIVWVYNDHVDPGRVEPEHPASAREVNLMGLVTQDRKRKRSFDLVKSFYTLLAGGGMPASAREAAAGTP